MFTLLTATAGLGILSILLLFLFSFFIVHLVLLARLGLLYQQEKSREEQAITEDKSPDNDKTAESNDQDTPTPEPVYYIVEKKRKTKASYSTPKQIKFK